MHMHKYTHTKPNACAIKRVPTYMYALCAHSAILYRLSRKYNLKEKLKLVKKEIDARDKLEKKKSEEMEVLKNEHESEKKMQESEYYGNIKGIRNGLHVTEILFVAFKEDMTLKYGYHSSAQTSDEELDVREISNQENN